MTAEVTTLDFNEAFPTIQRDNHEFGISTLNTPNAGEGWEFMVVEVPSRHGRDPIGVQVKMFDDSWKAYTDIPAFFTGLTALAENNEKVTLDHVKALCADLGYRDRTTEHAARHDHSFRCACGEFHPDELANTEGTNQ